MGIDYVQSWNIVHKKLGKAQTNILCVEFLEHCQVQ